MKQLRAQVAETARHLHERGWVANHDGNVTARGEGSRFIATPTATSKRLVIERNLIEVDSKGAVVGAGKVFGEIGLHLAVYERRRDVGCVIHAHPPYATAIASAAYGIDNHPIARPFIAEALVSIGPLIPKISYAQPGDEARKAVAPWCELVDAVLLGNHGVLAWGADVEQALLRLELVEHLAKIAVAAAPLGGVQPLPSSAIAPLLAARAKANIGYAADRAVTTAAQLGAHDSSAQKPVVACAPAPHSDVSTISPSGKHSSSNASLSDIVREEIVAALRR